MNYDFPSKVHPILKAVGLDFAFDGVSLVVVPSEEKADLVMMCEGKPLTSPECLALKAAITPEQWTAYQAVRKVPVTQARRRRYTEETDGMRLDADFDYKIGSLEWEAAIEKWREARRKIKEELPYPSEIEVK